MSYDVFISYSSKDKLAADAACATLEAQGIRCWIAPRDILPGQEWGAAIVHAIAEARVFVLLLSASANTSPQISREVERAVNRGIPVIPVRLEDVKPTASLEYFINTPHWLDAFAPPLDQHLAYLARVVRALLDGGAGVQPPPDPVDPPHPATIEDVSEDEPEPRGRRIGTLIPILVAIVAIAALAVAALAVWRLTAPKAGGSVLSSAAASSSAPSAAQQASVAPAVDASCLVTAASQPTADNCAALLSQNPAWQGCAGAFAQGDMTALTQRAQSLIDGGHSGVDLYESSPDFRAYGSISHYWEMLGQCVNNDVLKFSDLSGGVSFPDNFWTKTRPLRSVIGQNWQGAHQALPDFMSNFQSLCQRYKAERDKARPNGGASLDCSS